MPKRIMLAKYGQSEIRVENTWFNGATLFVDGDRVARANDYFIFNKYKPLISENVKLDGAERLVEVFMLARTTVKIKINVDGRQIGGEVF